MICVRETAKVAWWAAMNDAKEIDLTEDLLPAFDIQQQLAAQRPESATTLQRPVEGPPPITALTYSYWCRRSAIP